MDTKEKSLDFDFVPLVNEGRTEILFHPSSSPLDIGEPDSIENLSWDNFKDDISCDLHHSEFRFIDVMPLMKTPKSLSNDDCCLSPPDISDNDVLKDNVHEKDVTDFHDMTSYKANNINAIFDFKDTKNCFFNKLNSSGSENGLNNLCDSGVQKDLLYEICELCNQKFLSNGSKRTHMLKTHKIKLYILCALCDAKFFLRGELIKHISELHQSKTGKYSCMKCNRTFDNYRNIFLHMKNHCSEATSNETRVDSNIIIGKAKGRLGRNLEKKFACDKCGKRFAFSCLLADHINLHTGKKPHLCRICGKSFSQKASLKQHTRTHNAVRPHKCPECPQGFFGKGDLKKHIRLHTGERPYICEVCGDGFSQSSHLIVHQRIHTGDRPYRCDICSRGFTKNSDVVRHKRIHTGELPYKCKTCGKSFRQSTLCNNHVKTHHSADDHASASPLTEVPFLLEL